MEHLGPGDIPDAQTEPEMSQIHTHNRLGFLQTTALHIELIPLKLTFKIKEGKKPTFIKNPPNIILSILNQLSHNCHKILHLYLLPSL